jgi:hypothetical protein
MLNNKLLKSTIKKEKKKENDKIFKNLNLVKIALQFKLANVLPIATKYSEIERQSTEVYKYN